MRCPEAARFDNVNNDVVTLNMTDGYSEDNAVTQTCCAVFRLYLSQSRCGVRLMHFH